MDQEEKQLVANNRSGSALLPAQETFLSNIFEVSMAELLKGGSVVPSETSKAHSDAGPSPFEGTSPSSPSPPPSKSPSPIRPSMASTSSVLLKPDLSFLPTNNLNTNKSAVKTNWEAAQVVIGLSSALEQNKDNKSATKLSASTINAKAAKMEATVEHMKSSNRHNRAVAGRLRAERNALFSEIERLKTRGVRVNEDLVEQCRDHMITYDDGNHVWRDEKLDSVTPASVRTRFDSSWRARELDIDSLEESSSTNNVNGGKRRSKSSERKRYQEQNSRYKHHNSHENNSTTGDSSVERRPSQKNRRSRSHGGQGRSRSRHRPRRKSPKNETAYPSNKDALAKSQPLSIKDLNNETHQFNDMVNFEMSVDRQQRNMLSSTQHNADKVYNDNPQLKELQDTLIGEIREKKALSQNIIELREMVNDTDEARKTAKTAEIITSRALRQLEITLKFMYHSAHRRRRRESHLRCFRKWSVYSFQRKKGRITLSRALTTLNTGLEKGSRRAAVRVELCFRLWRMKGAIINDQRARSFVKVRKLAGLREKEGVSEVKGDGEDTAVHIQTKNQTQTQTQIQTQTQTQTQTRTEELARLYEQQRLASENEQTSLREKIANLMSSEEQNKAEIERLKSAVFENLQIMKRAQLDHATALNMAREEARIDLSGKKLDALASSDIFAPSSAPSSSAPLQVPSSSSTPHMCFSPRVIFKSWRTYNRANKRILQILASIILNARQKTLRKYLEKLKHSAMSKTQQQEIHRARAESDMLASSSAAMVERFELRALEIMTETSINSVASKILSTAMKNSLRAFKRVILRAWRLVHQRYRTRKHLEHHIGATSLFYFAINLVNRKRKGRAFYILKYNTNVPLNTIVYTLRSRHRSTIKAQVIAKLKSNRLNRRRFKFLLFKTAWDRVTKAFYKLLTLTKDNLRYLSSIYSKGLAVKHALNPKYKQTLKLAFGMLRDHTKLVYLTLNKFMDRWRINHFLVVRRNKAMYNALKKFETKQPLRIFFRGWVSRIHQMVKTRLTESSRKIYQTLAAGNLALTHEKHQKRHVILGWMNISVAKAFRIWHNMVEHHRSASVDFAYAETRHNTFVCREVLACWRRFLNERRAGVVSLHRWLKKSVLTKMQSRFDIWHHLTIIFHKRRAFATQTLFNINRKHALRHALAEFKVHAFERHRLRSCDVLSSEYMTTMEILKIQHVREKNEIFHSSLARSKIVHVIQSKYVHILSRAIGYWSKNVFGFVRLEKMAIKFSNKRRNQPLPTCFDRWVEFDGTRKALTRLLFRIFLKWHVRQLDFVFEKWSKLTRHLRVQKLQLKRVYGKINNRQLSRAFNKLYHICHQAMANEHVIVEKMFVNWLSYLTRRHRVKWLLLKLVGRNINDLFRESIKIWHLVAHKMADMEKFQGELSKTHTHIAHLKARSGGLALRYHHHHHKHFYHASLEKLFDAWVDLVNTMERKRKFATHYYKKHLLRLRRKVYSEWRRVAKDLKYGRRYLCMVVLNVYKSRLKISIERWKKAANDWQEIRRKQEKLRDSRMRRRLTSAFLGMKEMVAENSNHRNVYKCFLKCIKRILVESFWRWRLVNSHHVYLEKASDRFRESAVVKFKSKSFECWKRMRNHGRHRNSSLDIAIGVGTNGINRMHFFRWLKETRYMRVMANVEESEQWLLQKCIFKWRVFVSKVFRSSKNGATKVFAIAKKKATASAFRRWVRKTSLFAKAEGAITRLTLTCVRFMKIRAISIWSRCTQVDKYKRIRAESEALVGRMRASSEFEVTREQERIGELKKEAGLAILFLSLRFVQSSATTLLMGFKLFVCKVKQMSVFEDRRAHLLARVKKEKKRKTLDRWKLSVKQVNAASDRRTAARKVIRIVANSSLQNAVAKLRQNQSHHDRLEQQRRLRKATSISTLVMGCFKSDFVYLRFRRSFGLWKKFAADLNQLEKMESEQNDQVEVFNSEWTAKWEEEISRREQAEEELLVVKNNLANVQSQLTSQPPKESGWSKLRRKKSTLTFANVDQLQAMKGVGGFASSAPSLSGRTLSSKSSSTPPVSPMPTMRRLSTVVGAAHSAEKERQAAEREKLEKEKEAIAFSKEREEEDARERARSAEFEILQSENARLTEEYNAIENEAELLRLQNQELLDIQEAMDNESLNSSESEMSSANVTEEEAAALEEESKQEGRRLEKLYKEMHREIHKIAEIGALKQTKQVKSVADEVSVSCLSMVEDFTARSVMIDADLRKIFSAVSWCTKNLGVNEEIMGHAASSQTYGHLFLSKELDPSTTEGGGPASLTPSIWGVNESVAGDKVHVDCSHGLMGMVATGQFDDLAVFDCAQSNVNFYPPHDTVLLRNLVGSEDTKSKLSFILVPLKRSNGSRIGVLRVARVARTKDVVDAGASAAVSSSFATTKTVTAPSPTLLELQQQVLERKQREMERIEQRRARREVVARKRRRRKRLRRRKRKERLARVVDDDNSDDDDDASISSKNSSSSSSRSEYESKNGKKGSLAAGITREPLKAMEAAIAIALSPSPSSDDGDNDESRRPASPQNRPAFSDVEIGMIRILGTLTSEKVEEYEAALSKQADTSKLIADVKAENDRHRLEGAEDARREAERDWAKREEERKAAEMQEILNKSKTTHNIFEDHVYNRGYGSRSGVSSHPHPHPHSHPHPFQYQPSLHQQDTPMRQQPPPPHPPAPDPINVLKQIESEKEESYLEIKELERTNYVNEEERKRLAALVAKLGEEKILSRRIGQDSRENEKRLQTDLSVVSEYARGLEKKYRREKRRCSRLENALVVVKEREREHERLTGFLSGMAGEVEGSEEGVNVKNDGSVSFFVPVDTSTDATIVGTEEPSSDKKAQKSIRISRTGSVSIADLK